MEARDGFQWADQARSTILGRGGDRETGVLIVTPILFDKSIESISYKMLAAPIMPNGTTPLLNEKRRLSSRLDDMYAPEPKRPRRMDSKIVQEIGPGNNIKSIPESQALGQSELFLPMCLAPLRRTASLKAELQVSLLYNDNSRRPQLFTEPQVSLSNIRSTVKSTDDDSQKKPIVAGRLNHKDVDKGDGRIPVVNLKNNGVKQKSESPMIERIGALSTQNRTCSDVESDCSESGRTSILKSKLKQPAIVLTKMTQPIKKKATPSNSSTCPRPITPVASSSVVIGGYVQRMASLNARACVSAYLEPERKFSPKHKKAPSSSSSAPKPAVPNVPVTKNSGDSISRADSSVVPSVCKVSTETPKSKPVVVNLNGNESVIPIIKFDGNGSPSTLIIKELDDDSGVPYNSEGLLYNGDSIHPDARVFVADDKKFQLPKKIVPTLVPARLSTVKRAVKRATSTGILQSSKKHSKRNNGWCPLGEPIKVIKYHERSSKISRKYFAGIRRRKEDIFVRDSVVIKSDSGKSEKPYVAKIGSIWQESDGSLMMMTFWYYRPDDIQSQNPTTECVGRELFASQHRDVNSVSCIEEKCYVLGYLQYCRYHSSVVRSTVVNPLSESLTSGIVPDLSESIPQDDDEPQMDTDLIEFDPKKQLLEEPGPSLEKLQDTDPFLVYLCYRGFNHISGKIQSGRAG